MEIEDLDALLWRALEQPKRFGRWKKLLNELAETGWTLYCRKYENWDGSRNNFVGLSSSWDHIEQFLSQNNLSIDQLTYEIFNSLREEALTQQGMSYSKFEQQYFSWEAVGLFKEFKRAFPDQEIKHSYIEVTDYLREISNITASYSKVYTLSFRIHREIRYNLQGESFSGPTLAEGNLRVRVNQEANHEVSMPWASESFTKMGRDEFIKWIISCLKQDGQFAIDEF